MFGLQKHCRWQGKNDSGTGEVNMAEQNGRDRTYLARRPALELTGLFISVIAIGVSIYLSIRAEQEKSLVLRSLSSRSLITAEASRSGDLKVSLNDKVVAKPWLLSARLENSGSIPIEQRDIEKPLTMQFPRAVVLRAEITRRGPADVTAQVLLHKNAVRLEHGLLNPADWIEFDILFDGEPGAPDLSYRVTGLTSRIALALSDKQSSPQPAWISLPTPVHYLLLTITTLGILAAAIGGATVTISELRSSIKHRREAQAAVAAAAREITMIRQGEARWERLQELIRELGFYLPRTLYDTIPEPKAGYDIQASGDRVLEPLVRVVNKLHWWSHIDREPVIFGCLMLIAGLSAIVIITGNWAVLLVGK